MFIFYYRGSRSVPKQGTVSPGPSFHYRSVSRREMTFVGDKGIGRPEGEEGVVTVKDGDERKRSAVMTTQ